MRKNVMLLYSDKRELGLLKAKVVGLPWVCVVAERNLEMPITPKDPPLVLSWCKDLPTALSVKRKVEGSEPSSLLLFCPPSQLRLIRLMQHGRLSVLGSTADTETVGSAILSLCRDGFSVGESQALLTCREKEVVDLIISGQCNKEIAQVLGIKSSTVLAHKKHLFMKIGVHSTQELVVWALLKQFGQ